MTLKINGIYSQQDIKNELDCTIMRGMNYKKDTNRLILIRNHIKSIYEDKQEGDILYYTGEGRQGNQTLTAANKRLVESKENSTEVLLFEVFKTTEYTYKGEVKLIDKPFIEKQLDEDDNLRNVYVFPLRILNESAYINDNNTVIESRELKLKRIKKATDEEVFNRAQQTGQEKPGYSYTKTKVYQRSEYVIEAVLRRAKGVCELCQCNAPFIKKDGTAYLEVHHIKQLAKGGSDRINNAVALCPNCHRKIHSLNLSTDIKKLKAIAT
jgi:5-methylcytosine-specific restriction protein A